MWFQSIIIFCIDARCWWAVWAALNWYKRNAMFRILLLHSLLFFIKQNDIFCINWQLSWLPAIIIRIDIATEIENNMNILSAIFILINFHLLFCINFSTEHIFLLSSQLKKKIRCEMANDAKTMLCHDHYDYILYYYCNIFYCTFSKYTWLLVYWLMHKPTIFWLCNILSCCHGQ